MPTCLYLRGAPGTGKRTVSDVLERDLGWPVLWVHHFDAVYKAIGEHRVPRLTDDLMNAVADYLTGQLRNFIIVRPTRDTTALKNLGMTAGPEWRKSGAVLVRLPADYATLCTRVTRRWHESPYRITTREALDEYLNARPEEPFAGEHVIDTTHLTPEQVAGRVKELLPK